MTKKNKAGSITLPNFRLYYQYKSKVIKEYGTGTKKPRRSMEQRLENLELIPHIYLQVIYNKGFKSMMEKRQYFQ